MDGSVEVIRGENRRRTLWLSAVMAAALGAAGYEWLRPQGTGNPEEDHKVLVVSEGPSVYGEYLSDLGFDAVSAPLETWQREIVDEMGGPPEGGLPELLAFADRYGFGVVVLENPERFDFTGVETSESEAGESPAFESHVRFATLSAGDFAFPHQLGVNAPPSEIYDTDAVALLSALFAQPRLDAAIHAADVSMDALTRRSKVAHAIEALERVEKVEAKAQRRLRDWEAQLQGKDARYALLDEVLEGSRILPLADGRLLFLSRGGAYKSSNGTRLDFVVETTWRLSSLAPSSELEAEARQACPDFLGGSVGLDEEFEWVVSDDGRSLLTHRRRQGWELWQLQETPRPESCGLERVGEVPGLARAGYEPGGVQARFGRPSVGPRAPDGSLEIWAVVPSERGILPMPRPTGVVHEDPPIAAVELWRVRPGAEAPEVVATIAGESSGEVHHLDEQTLSFPLRLAQEADGTAFVRLDRALEVSHYRGGRIQELRAQAPLPGEAALIRMGRAGHGDRIERLELRPRRGADPTPAAAQATWAELSTDWQSAEPVLLGEEGLGLAPPLGAPIAEIRRLDEASFDTRLLVHDEGGITEFSRSPDGAELAYVHKAKGISSISVVSTRVDGEVSVPVRITDGLFQSADPAYLGGRGSGTGLLTFVSRFELKNRVGYSAVVRALVADP